MKGILIDAPWIDEILGGRKTWELRAKAWKHRGEVALIRTGTKQVVGVAKIIDCLDPLDETSLRSSFEFHRVPVHMIEEVLAKNWRVPWVLADIRQLPSAVSYIHKSGSQTPVNVNDEAVREIRKQLVLARPAARNLSVDYPKPTPLALNRTSDEERARRMAAMPHIGGTSVRSLTDADFPPVPSAPVVPAGLQPPAVARPSGQDVASRTAEARRMRRQRRSKDVRLLLQVLAALGMSICFLVWLGHLFVVGPMEALFAWGGVRWLLWSIAGGVILGASSSDPLPASVIGRRPSKRSKKR